MSEPRRDNIAAFPGQRLTTPHLHRMADVLPERIRWLSRGRLAAGKITILDGDPGLGKSTLMLDWAARMTRGEALPDGEPGTPRAVVILSAEDGEGDTIRPRLAAAGADLSRVFTFWMRDEDGEYLATIPHDLDGLFAQVEATRAALVIVDPLMAFLAGDIKSNSDQDVRRALSPFGTGLERTGAAALIARHLNKAVGMASLYRGGGSIGIIGAARFGLLVAKDPDDESGQRRILAVQKCNIGPEGSSLAYRLEGVPGTDVARVVWEGESHHRASHLTNPGDEGERAANAETEAWLADVLTSGPVFVKDLQKQARDDGISPQKLDRAKRRLGVQHKREGFGPNSKMKWWLPKVSVGGTPAQFAPYASYSSRHTHHEKPAEPRDISHTPHTHQASDGYEDDPFTEDGDE